MVRKPQKSAVLIMMAFLVLCAVSAYRQLSLRFIPGDPARPVAVYFVYLLLLAGWWTSIRSRIAQRNMRGFLMAEHCVILIGITTRFVQDAILYRDTYLMRVSGYLIAILLIFCPLFGFFASLFLGKTEGYRISRNWYYLLIPAGILAVLTLTNEDHHLVFSMLVGESRTNLFFHPNIGLYMLIAFAFSLEFARVFIILYRNRDLSGDARIKSVPWLVICFMLAVSAFYLINSFAVRFEIIEYSAFIFFFEAVVWETCIISGSVPVNTHYEEVFDRSVTAMQIVDCAGRVCMKSAFAPELPAEIFEQLKREASVLTPDGQELRRHAIRGGHVVWQTDISRTIAANDALHKNTQRLEQDSELLSQELKIRSEEETVKEQNRIYNQLTTETGDKLTLLRDLLAKQEWTVDKIAYFKKICLIGTYVKRRCNLRLVEQSDGEIPGRELELCYYELAACLSQMGIEADALLSDAGTPDPEFAIFSLDVFELLLEHERFEPRSIKINFESDTAFSVRVRPKSTQPEPPDDEELRSVNRLGYCLSWQTFEREYQVSARDGRR